MIGNLSGDIFNNTYTERPSEKEQYSDDTQLFDEDIKNNKHSNNAKTTQTNTKTTPTITLGAVLPVGIFLFWVVIILVTVAHFNDQHFTYSLDDPYIHLALAENIATGHYGINLNEYSAPSSSIAWPFLLAPFSQFDNMDWVPLIINTIASVGVLVLMYNILLRFGRNQFTGKDVAFSAIFVSLIIPFVNLVGLAFTGMEHSLHLFVSMLSLYGLGIVCKNNNHTPIWLWPLLVLGPLIRFEGLAFSLPILLFLFLKGYRWQSSATFILLSSLVAGFCIFLQSIGLGYLPSSIVAKSVSVSGFYESIPFIKNIFHNSIRPAGWLLMIGLILLWRYWQDKKNPQYLRELAIVVFGSGSLHFIAGDFGWYGRYEIYIYVPLLTTTIALYRDKIAEFVTNTKPLKQCLVFGALFLMALQYALYSASTPIASNNIYHQQYQMHRFATEYYKKPVGVNDLGWVAYQNPNYVLDFWGLASKESLEHRLKGGDAKWMDAIAKKKGVKLVMIYDGWFENIPSNWKVVGQLYVEGLGVTLGSKTVSFYATNNDEIPTIKAALKAFEKTLPGGTELLWPNKAALARS